MATRWHTRLRKGFTIMELLIVVAVLSVIMAVAAPNLAQVMRHTEMVRLDAYAKEMYVAIQDQLIGMESTGEYVAFNQALEAAPTRNLGQLGTMPSDAQDSRWQNYYYVTSFGGGSSDEGAADAAFSQVVARTAIIDGITRGGRYIAELNPRPDGTDVYSVFYSEDPNFSYADVVNLASREKEDRRSTASGYPVGYYSGIAAPLADAPTSFRPRATFINGEELFLNIRCQGGMALVGSDNNMQVKVVLSDGVSEEAILLQGGRDFTLDSAGNLDIDVVVDSLRPGMGFADVAPTLQPGADITATVEVEYRSADLTIVTPDANRGEAVANSLYSQDAAGLVEVANVRHLANLAYLPATTFAVWQVADIDFNAQSWGAADNTRLSQATQAYNDATYATPYVNPLDLERVDGATGFVPIQPDADADWEFDGRGNKLTNFRIQGASPTGFFSVVRQNQRVENVVLVDAIVSGQGNTGALAGEVYGQLANCGVRLDVSSEADAAKQSVDLVTASGNGSVGGLVGYAGADAGIARCYAAVDVAAPEAAAVGGLVGTFASSGAISSSYASGILDGNTAVGGLVGALEAGTVQDCYTTADISSGSVVGGAFGTAGGGQVANTNAYGRVSVSAGGGFVGNAGGATFENCSYLQESGYNDTLGEQPTGVSAKTLMQLSAARLAADHSHPYLATIMRKPFPFANVLEDHWGNWPDTTGQRPVLVYYEHYADESYGYYAQAEDEYGPMTINTLDETLVLVDDGYAVMSPYVLRGIDYSLNSSDMQRLTLATEPAAGRFVEIPATDLFSYSSVGEVSLAGMHIYQLPFELQMPDREADALYDVLRLRMVGSGGLDTMDYTYYYNPDFAKQSVSPNADGTTTPPDDPGALLVRTARQLNRLGVQPAYWDRSIAQDRDIDFAYYTNSYLGVSTNYLDVNGGYRNQPIGRSGQPFTGTFDGRDNVIVDFCLHADGQMATGMFGEVRGTVRNVHLASAELGSAFVERAGAPAGTPALGALAGWVEGGAIEGCSVSGYRVSFGATDAGSIAGVGGLVGVNKGSVARSTVGNVAVSLDASSGSGTVLGVGGLVGGNGGSIDRCYAVEADVSCSTSTSGSGRLVGLGGVQGCAINGSPAVSNSYGYLLANDPRCSQEDVVERFAIANPAETNVTNCYYLDLSEYGEEVDEAEAATPCDPYGLQHASLPGFAGPDEPRGTYGETMSGHVVQAADSYPYPVICKDAYGDWAHYGFDWRQ